MLGREKETSRNGAVKMDNIKDLLGVRTLYRMPNAQLRMLCGYEGTDESIFH